MNSEEIYARHGGWRYHVAMQVYVTVLSTGVISIVVCLVADQHWLGLDWGAICLACGLVATFSRAIAAASVRKRRD